MQKGGKYMKKKRNFTMVIGLAALIGLAIMGMALAQSGKKIDCDVGWVTLDKKTLTLVRDGKHVMDVELDPAVVVKIMEEQKPAASGKEGKKSGKKDKEAKKEEAAKEGKDEPVKEAKKEGKKSKEGKKDGQTEQAAEGGKEAAAPGVTTVCYTIRPATVNDILSGWKASVTYEEQGKKKMAREIVLMPVVFGGGDDE